jgi:MFS family permease
MITAYIPAEQKEKAMSIIMLFAALGTAIGPTVGGVLTQYLSWHWSSSSTSRSGSLPSFSGQK